MASSLSINSPKEFLDTKAEVDALQAEIDKLKAKKKEILNNLSPEQKNEIKQIKDKRKSLEAEKKKLDDRQAEIAKLLSNAPGMPWWLIAVITVALFFISSVIMERSFANKPEAEQETAAMILFFICIGVFAVLAAIRIVGSIKFRKFKQQFNAEKAEISARLPEIDKEIKALPDEEKIEESFLDKDYDEEIKALKSRQDVLKNAMTAYSNNKKLENHIFVYIGTYSARPGDNYYGRYGSISQARVTIDGQDRGSTTSLRGFAVTPGRHTVEVEVYEESNEIYGTSTPEEFYVNGDYQVYFYRLNTYNHNLSLRTYDDIDEFKRDSRLSFNVSSLVR